jgi:hypothetical protein
MKNDLPKYKQLIAFIDLVFNMMMAFAFLFILAFALMNIQENKKAKIDPKAEALIVMTWPDYAVEDLDLWLKLPSDRYVSFKNTNTDLANIERDDRGMYGDYIQMPDGKIVRNPINKEVITLRALTPGEYVVAMHHYSGMGSVDQWTEGLTAEEKAKVKRPPYPIKIQLIKLNPVYKEVISVEIVAEIPGEEKTAFSFTIDERGNFLDISTKENLFVTNAAAQEALRQQSTSRPWAQPWAPARPATPDQGVTP